MSNTVIRVENVSKKYKLGSIGTGTLTQDLNRWWAQVRGKEDPTRRIDENGERSGEHWALRDVSFDIKQGEAIGIIGKNGAGKSTLLKILSRTTTPTTGRIRVKGRIASLLEVGTGFHPDLTGRENVFMNGAILGMNRAEIRRKFDEIVTFSGIEKYIDTPVKRYSSGMYVRLAFAVAAHLESEILILDEVLAVGDAEFQKKCLGKMGDVANKEGRTVLFVSHNMAAIRTLCQKGIMLQQGSLLYSGSAEDAVELYLSKNTGIQSAIPLDERIDREGDGKFRFTGISFLNKKEEEITEAISGDPLTIKLDYIAKESLNSDKMILGLNFFDQYKNIIVSLLTDEMGSKLDALNSCGSIYLNIPKLLLRGGEYPIRLWSSYINTHPESRLDVIEDAAVLTVLPGDFWRSGKTNRAGHALLMEGEFMVKSESILKTL